MKPPIRWGIVGCGAVTEIKSGPGFQKAVGSELVAVMRRDLQKAEDYAKRHGVPRFYGDAEELILDPQVDAVYVATPPDSHCALALKVAEAGKPCLVEKPMARTHAECQRMIEVFQGCKLPLFVAYYRRAMPRFLKVRDLLRQGAIGDLTSIHIVQFDRLLTGDKAKAWRLDPAVAGAGLFLDLASHGLDLLDFLVGPIKKAAGFAINTGKSYEAEDVTAACFEFESGVAGTGVWNFNADHSENQITFTGSKGELQTPVFSNEDIVLHANGREEHFPFKRPDHVHQYLIQTIVDQLQGRGSCESTGESGARTSWVMDRCLESYYGDRRRRETGDRSRESENRRMD